MSSCYWKWYFSMALITLLLPGSPRSPGQHLGQISGLRKWLGRWLSPHTPGSYIHSTNMRWPLLCAKCCFRCWVIRRWPEQTQVFSSHSLLCIITLNKFLPVLSETRETLPKSWGPERCPEAVSLTDFHTHIKEVSGKERNSVWTGVSRAYRSCGIFRRFQKRETINWRMSHFHLLWWFSPLQEKIVTVATLLPSLPHPGYSKCGPWTSHMVTTWDSTEMPSWIKIWL